MFQKIHFSPTFHFEDVKACFRGVAYFVLCEVSIIHEHGFLV